MKKIVIMITLLVLAYVPMSQADSIPSNVEYLDEANLIYEIGGSDAIWGSKNLDVGVMTGISNLGNPWNTEKTSSYFMVKADVKGICLLNRILNVFKK